MDARVEEAVHSALRRLMEGRTTLLIAHRRSTLHLADRIAVVEGGRVVEQGTHEELAATSQRYQALLAGLGSGAAATVGDRVDGVVALGPGRDIARASAGPGEPQPSPPAAQQARRAASPLDVSGSAPGTARTVGAPGIGPGLGGGGGGWRLNLAPTPELLDRVAKLPPVRDVAVVDLDEEAAPDPGFSLRRLLGEFRRPLIVGLVLVVLDSMASLAGPVLVKTGLDSGVARGSAAVLFATSGVYLLVVLADLVDQVGETFVTGRTAQRIMLSLRARIWAQLQRLSLDYYEQEMAGRIMTRMTTDVDQFESLVQNGFLSALVAVVTFVGVAVSLVVVNPELGLCTLSVVVPLSLATVAFRRRASRLYELSRERIGIVNADFQESLSGVRESQAFVHEGLTMRRFHQLGRDYLEPRVAAQRLVATYFPFVQLLAGLADAIVLGVGAGLMAHHQLASGALVAFILYIDLLFSPIQQLSQVFDSWQQTRVSVGRISELMRLEPLTPDRPGGLVVQALTGEASLEDVHFAYPTAVARSAAGNGKGAEAVRGVALHIKAGETVALVGETGAGKSTLVKLLARFYDPDSGTVRADGHDLRSLQLGSYRRRLGYVPQEAFLFSGSIRHNIAFGRPWATDGEVEAAARAVGAHDLVISLPGGYSHELSERGRSLSAGQRQLLALARAELVKPALLLLDEATSNLDLASEAKVNAAMQRVADGRTTVLIAHRLQTARSADRIVVLHAGQVAEVGTHDELLQIHGRYAAMWEAFEMVTGTA